MIALWMLFIQEIPDGVIETISKVSPYDATAYGGLVLVLLVTLYLQYKDKQRQAESLEKLVDTLKDIEINLRAIPDLKMLILSRLLNNKPDSDV